MALAALLAGCAPLLEYASALRAPTEAAESAESVEPTEPTELTRHDAGDQFRIADETADAPAAIVAIRQPPESVAVAAEPAQAAASDDQFDQADQADHSDQATGAQAAQAALPPDDLWPRLRGNFRLSDQRLNASRLRHFEDWYSSRPGYFARLVQRAHWFLPFVLAEVEKRGMPGEIALLPAIESAFRLDAVSHSNAVGLWQFIASTGRRFGLRQDWWVDERRDLVHSTRAALDYLDFLEKEFNGDWELALAAYNAGEGAVRRRVADNRRRNKPTDYSSLRLRRETADYVPKLLAVRNIIQQPDQYGITLEAIPNRPTLAMIDARSQTDLSVAASAGGINRERLRWFNRGYKRGSTPPNGPHILVVPMAHSTQLRTALDQLGAEARLRWARHQVRPGEYLGKIAKKYGVTVSSIVSTNQLTSSLIHPRQELRIPLSTGRWLAESTTREGDILHQVKPGDSLWRISRRYGVSIPQLTRWNRISPNALLHPGQSLVVGR